MPNTRDFSHRFTVRNTNMSQIDCISTVIATCLCVPVCTILKSSLDIGGGGGNVNYADNFKNVKSCCISHNIHVYGQTDN